MPRGTMVKRLLQPVYTFYVLIVFVLSILAILPFVILFSFRDSTAWRRFIFAIIRGWSAFWLTAIGMPVKTIGNRPGPGKYIIIANHISYIDSLLLFPAVRDYFRPLGKKEFARIPIIGLIYRQIVILVDRTSAFSRAKSMRLLWRVLNKDGSIAIFPEGTFNETGQPLKGFYDGAFRLAINTGTPLLPVILPDSVNRWHYSAWWKIWPGRNRAVILPPVPTNGLSLSDLPRLKEELHTLMANTLISLSAD